MIRRLEHRNSEKLRYRCTARDQLMSAQATENDRYFRLCAFVSWEKAVVI